MTETVVHHTRWVRSPDDYFLPKAVLRKVFRGKFVAALRQAFQNGELYFPEKLKLLAQRKIFGARLRPLFRQHWVVYLKRPFGGPEYVVQYLDRYIHRVAISNHRWFPLPMGKPLFAGAIRLTTNRSSPVCRTFDFPPEFFPREFLCLVHPGARCEGVPILVVI
jgi:hypothetical protein